MINKFFLPPYVFWGLLFSGLNTIKTTKEKLMNSSSYLTGSGWGVLITHSRSLFTTIPNSRTSTISILNIVFFPNPRPRPGFWGIPLKSPTQFVSHTE